ncbi:MAG TPA: hypothetical protein VFR24_25995 [Candidatus Angelobacter sp.]|nr:hypothetical protein [Candidatus Angelobacter sp.]
MTIEKNRIFTGKRIFRRVIALFTLVSMAMANTVGPNGPASAAASGSGATWSNPTNALANDGVFATALIPSNLSSNQLQVTNFGFSIPAGSTINGIQVDTENQSASSTLMSIQIQILQGGAAAGTAKSGNPPNAYPAVKAFVTFGNGTDLWGTTWAPSDINSTGFGVQQQAFNASTSFGSANVDFVRITVFYTLPAPTGGGKHRTIQTQVRSGAPTRVIGAV